MRLYFWESDLFCPPRGGQQFNPCHHRIPLAPLPVGSPRTPGPPWGQKSGALPGPLFRLPALSKVASLLLLRAEVQPWDLTSFLGHPAPEGFRTPLVAALFADQFRGPAGHPAAPPHSAQSQGSTRFLCDPPRPPPLLKAFLSSLPPGRTLAQNPTRVPLEASAGLKWGEEEGANT